MTCSHAELDGSYVLGALSPTERLEYEQHLETCDACARSVRELAGLPGLLSRVDPAVLEEPSDVAEPVPEGLALNLVREVRRERRRRFVVTVGLAAAAILAVGGLIVGGAVSGAFERDSGSSPVAGAAKAQVMTPVGDVPVTATLALEPVAWGTRLDLACRYAPDSGYGATHAPTYTLFVRTRDGHTQEVGTWRSVDGKTMRLAAATASRRQDIAAVEVRTANGRTVLRLNG